MGVYSYTRRDERRCIVIDEEEASLGGLEAKGNVKSSNTRALL